VRSPAGLAPIYRALGAVSQPARTLQQHDLDIGEARPSTVRARSHCPRRMCADHRRPDHAVTQPTLGFGSAPLRMASLRLAPLRSAPRLASRRLARVMVSVPRVPPMRWGRDGAATRKAGDGGNVPDVPVADAVSDSADGCTKPSAACATDHQNARSECTGTPDRVKI